MRDWELKWEWVYCANGAKAFKVNFPALKPIVVKHVRVHGTPVNQVNNMHMYNAFAVYECTKSRSHTISVMWFKWKFSYLSKLLSPVTITSFKRLSSTSFLICKGRQHYLQNNTPHFQYSYVCYPYTATQRHTAHRLLHNGHSVQSRHSAK